MKPLYTIVLSPTQVAIGLALLCTLMVIVFWILPGIPRAIDRKGGVA